MKDFPKKAIKWYQKDVSPKLPGMCIYTPTCSNYTLEAIEKHGNYHGIRLGIKRLIRCNPWAEGGHDPVPETIERRSLIRPKSEAKKSRKSTEK